jgi:hypothetical protein
MRLLRHLQHWLSGQGPRLHVADVVREAIPFVSRPIHFPGRSWSTPLKNTWPSAFPNFPAAAVALWQRACYWP